MIDEFNVLNQLDIKFFQVDCGTDPDCHRNLICKNTTQSTLLSLSNSMIRVTVSRLMKPTRGSSYWLDRSLDSGPHPLHRFDAHDVTPCSLRSIIELAPPRLMGHKLVPVLNSECADEHRQLPRHFRNLRPHCPHFTPEHRDVVRKLCHLSMAGMSHQ